MKIAIVRLSSLGDIILGMVSLQFIHRRLPGCSITWVADKRFADILDHQPDIHQLIKLDLKGFKKNRSFSGLFREYHSLASAGPFDAVIDLHGMIKSAITARILGGRRYGFDCQMVKEPLSNLFYQQTFAIPLDMPAACRYATLVANSLGFALQPGELSDVRPFLFGTETDRAATDKYFSPEHRNIIFVPGTSADYKNYPPEKLARLAAILGQNILICHGNELEYRTAAMIAGQSTNVRLLPRLTLNQLKAAVARSDLVIGGDTGPTHIAWGCGVPSITLFGATPVCIQPTERNRVISTSSRVNLRKHDSSDNSVRDIPEEAIVQLAWKLLK